MILCVAGSPSIDRLFEVDRLTHGDIHRPERFVALPGGKGIHVAQVATAPGQRRSQREFLPGTQASGSTRSLRERESARGSRGRPVRRGRAFRWQTARRGA